jgi:hypothetical protein
MTKEEAIKLVKRIKGAMVYTEEEKEALETLIPELKESEDETVRKALIDLVSTVGEYYLPKLEVRNKMLAYLEKQKESLHIPESCKENADSFISEDERIRKWIKKEIEDKYVVEGIVNNKLADEAFGWLEKQKYLYETTKDRFYREGFEEGQLYEKQKEQKHPNGCFTCDEYKKGYEEGRRNGFTAGYNKAIKEVEQNVEQKPAEWSDADNIGWDEAFSCVTRAERAAKSEEELQNAVTAEKWLKEIKFKYYVHPQPKQEWSENDKQWLSQVYFAIDHSIYSEDERQAMKKYIDFLRSQSKPAEFNDNDDQVIGFIFDLLNALVWRKDWAMSKEECLERLKSLRPSWKPSEEELVALKRAGSILRDYGHSELAKTVFMIEGKLANLSIINKPIWKPSEDQMKALQCAIVFMETRKASDYDMTPLKSLYEQLKAL